MIKMEFQTKKKYVKDKNAYPQPVAVVQRLIPPITNPIGYNMIANLTNSTPCGVCPHS
jgi:hypothetical protein